MENGRRLPENLRPLVDQSFEEWADQERRFLAGDNRAEFLAEATQQIKKFQPNSRLVRCPWEHPELFSVRTTTGSCNSGRRRNGKGCLQNQRRAAGGLFAPVWRLSCPISAKAAAFLKIHQKSSGHRPMIFMNPPRLDALLQMSERNVKQQLW